MTQRICIVGYGNPQRGDDGLGPLVVKRVRAGMGPRPGLRFFTFQQLGEELPDAIAEANLLILVDATVEDLPQGIFWRRIEPIARFSLFSHHMDPCTWLWLLERERGWSPETWLVSIKGEAFEIGEGISPKAVELARRAAKEIAAFLERRMSPWKASLGDALREADTLACQGQKA